MNQLTKEKRVQVLACLIEGNSVRSTVRLTGVAKTTVTKLLIDAGRACAQYQDETLVMYPIKVSKWMRYGHFTTPRRRMYPRS